MDQDIPTPKLQLGLPVSDLGLTYIEPSLYLGLPGLDLGLTYLDPSLGLMRIEGPKLESQSNTDPRS